MELTLSFQPLHELDPVIDDTQELTVLERIGLKHIAMLAKARAEHRSIRFMLVNQCASLSWGDGELPETFCSNERIENDLWVLHHAEQQGMFGDLPVSHDQLRQYFAVAV